MSQDPPYQLYFDYLNCRKVKLGFNRCLAYSGNNIFLFDRGILVSLSISSCLNASSTSVNFRKTNTTLKSTTGIFSSANIRRRYVPLLLCSGRHTSSLHTLVSSPKMKELLSSDIKNEDKYFLEWFCGFTDGEGSFMVMKNGSKHINFRFAINLHIDDIGVLEFIQGRLGIGKVYSYGNSASFIVKNLKEVGSIINIFSKYPLKTHKYLNFLDFSRAYLLYSESEIKTPELVEEILNIKSQMNSKRTNFERPFNIAGDAPLENKAMLISPN